ncbi:MAG: T9SS type A sorting domain-containing protein [Bacteroidota bacterium]
MEETKLKSISFFEGSGTGIVCGITSPVLMNAPYLSRTSDYGATWETQNLTLDYGIVLIGADLLSSVNGFVGGTDCILKTTNGGSVSIHQSSETSPDKFTLSQNYPNPFNPNTKINYELRITNYVTLKVFDVLGNEVRTLVNEKQNAGSYQVDFEGSGLSSGIYFYTLKTDGFSETKRMTLLK